MKLKILFFSLLLNLMILPNFALGNQLHVARFWVNGPDNSQYLGQAAQDAVVGVLQEYGEIHALQEKIDPDQLPQANLNSSSMLLAGRIHVVGNQYRVSLKWSKAQGLVGKKYLSAKNLNDLIPKLEKFARQQRKQLLTAVPAPKIFIPSSQPTAKTPPSAPKPDPVSISLPPPVKVQAAKPVPPKIRKEIPKKNEKVSKISVTREYDFISERFPFEVRAIAHGDINQDGQAEVLLSSQRQLHLYKYIDQKFSSLAKYQGAKLDYFVKVDFWQHPQEGVLVVLTNLRGDRASSKVLRYQNAQFTPWIENIPYQLRVMKQGGEQILLGAPYHASSDTQGGHAFRLEIVKEKLKVVKKFRLPKKTNLYNYAWSPLPKSSELGLMALTPLGKLSFHQKQGKGFRKLWSARETYGGSGNYIPVKMKNVFNEVVGDYFSVPVGIESFSNEARSQIIVVKNHSLVKSVVGRVPVISQGQIFRMSYDEMGFISLWESKKVDGSIQDYLVTGSASARQLMVAVKLRDPGLLGEIGRNDSVVLIYNLD